MQADFTLFLEIVGVCIKRHPDWIRLSELCEQLPGHSGQAAHDCLQALEPQGVWSLRMPADAADEDYEVRVNPEKVPTGGPTVF